MAGETRIVTHKHAEPIKILLKRTTDGGYIWDITASAATVDEAVLLIQSANGRMQATYGKKKGAA